MKIFIIRRTDDVDYDQFDEIIVRAKDEESAFNISKKYVDEVHEGSHNNSDYFVKENVDIVDVTKNNNEEVLLSSYNAG